MGKKRNAAAAGGIGQAADAPSGLGQDSKRRRPSEIRVGLRALSDSELEARFRALADEVREAQLRQQQVRDNTKPGRARLDPVPRDRARTNAMNAVQKAEQAYAETQAEWERRGLKLPRDFNPARTR
mmetsp:Transcript_113459/g.326213  ORF Transcript_113459/g.326213 Transcript_113459/m.326213 type:complete len:127 (-) Transcript_113459:85-465(-)